MRSAGTWRVQYMFSYIKYLPKCEKTGNKEKQNGGRRNVVLNTTVYKGKMQVSQPNNVKIYNLSAGKSLPEVLKKSSCYILFIWKQFVFVLRFCTCLGIAIWSIIWSYVHFVSFLFLAGLLNHCLKL